MKAENWRSFPEGTSYISRTQWLCVRLAHCLMWMEWKLACSLSSLISIFYLVTQDLPIATIFTYSVDIWPHWGRQRIDVGALHWPQPGESGRKATRDCTWGESFGRRSTRNEADAEAALLEIGHVGSACGLRAKAPIKRHLSLPLLLDLSCLVRPPSRRRSTSVATEKKENQKIEVAYGIRGSRRYLVLVLPEVRPAWWVHLSLGWQRQ